MYHHVAACIILCNSANCLKIQEALVDEQNIKEQIILLEYQTLFNIYF